MHGWLTENEAPRALIIDTDRPPWVSHEAFYGCWMFALCLRLRWAREKWIRSLFLCLCMQFQVDTTEDLAAKLRVCMDRDGSIIYVGFSFSSKRPYYGLVEAANGSSYPVYRMVDRYSSASTTISCCTEQVQTS